MTTTIETPEAALLWLADLEESCESCQPQDSLTYVIEFSSTHCTVCGGFGKVPVLDLREPCPGSDGGKDGN